MQLLQQGAEASIRSQRVKTGVGSQDDKPSRSIAVTPLKPFEHSFIAQPKINERPSVRRHVPTLRQPVKLLQQFLGIGTSAGKRIGAAQRASCRWNLIRDQRCAFKARDRILITARRFVTAPQTDDWAPEVGIQFQGPAAFGLGRSAGRQQYEAPVRWTDCVAGADGQCAPREF
jgi:hypothetical protein